MADSKPFQKPVFILKEGSNRLQGKDARRANITAARIVAEAVKSAFGPRGMDKMLVDSIGDITITSDGRTILEEMDIEHPAAKMMVEVAKAQDGEVGDGTSTSVILAGELLGNAESLISKNVHPAVIIEGYDKAAGKALKTLEKIAIPVKPTDKKYLKKVAITSMASKIVSENKEQLAVQSFAEAIETVPSVLGENAGLDPIDILSELRARHEKGEKWVGVDVFEGKINDAKKLEVYEPLVVKKQIIKSATEAATMILRIDDVIDAGKMKTPPSPPSGPPGMASVGYGGVPPQY